MKKYKVKYATLQDRIKLYSVFGMIQLHGSNGKKNNKENGDDIQFLMSYEVKTEAQSRPELRL